MVLPMHPYWHLFCKCPLKMYMLCWGETLHKVHAKPKMHRQIAINRVRDTRNSTKQLKIALYAIPHHKYRLLPGNAPNSNRWMGATTDKIDWKINHKTYNQSFISNTSPHHNHQHISTCHKCLLWYWPHSHNKEETNYNTTDNPTITSSHLRWWPNCSLHKSKSHGWFGIWAR